MTHVCTVLEVIGKNKVLGGYKVHVSAENLNKQVFDYTFIKNKEEDADEIVVGFIFIMDCNPIIRK